MGKKCIICGEEGQFCIKGSNECYCEECAKENFSDLTYLQKVEEAAAAIKEAIKEDYDY
ncbi:hypothetical protein KY328_01290 [Candidatus Woesearchaeota archaeon]|nr:hypothetical protein [Candidatus Woesearchaeota archaeon]MBW3021532.1 hypothetical protein [Candidatus Woesearchaeota archaeon]